MQDFSSRYKLSMLRMYTYRTMVCYTVGFFLIFISWFVLVWSELSFTLFHFFVSVFFLHIHIFLILLCFVFFPHPRPPSSPVNTSSGSETSSVSSSATADERRRWRTDMSPEQQWSHGGTTVRVGRELNTTPTGGWGGVEDRARGKLLFVPSELVLLQCCHGNMLTGLYGYSNMASSWSARSSNMLPMSSRMLTVVFCSATELEGEREVQSHRPRWRQEVTECL